MRKKNIFVIMMIVLSIVLIATQFVCADESATIWTTDEYGNPVNDFPPESIVYIHGSGFTSYNTVQINITRPDGIVQTAPGSNENYYRFPDYLPTVDSDGTFSYTYDLDGIYGLYNLNAYDGILISTITFMDATQTTNSLDSIPIPITVGQSGIHFYGNVTSNPSVPILSSSHAHPTAVEAGVATISV